MYGFVWKYAPCQWFITSFPDIAMWEAYPHFRDIHVI